MYHQRQFTHIVNSLHRWIIETNAINWELISIGNYVNWILVSKSFSHSNGKKIEKKVFWISFPPAWNLEFHIKLETFYWKFNVLVCKSTKSSAHFEALSLDGVVLIQSIEIQIKWNKMEFFLWLLHRIYLWWKKFGLVFDGASILFYFFGVKERIWLECLNVSFFLGLRFRSIYTQVP